MKFIHNILSILILLSIKMSDRVRVVGQEYRERL